MSYQISLVGGKQRSQHCRFQSCFYNMNLQLTLHITFCLFKCETEGQILKKLSSDSAQLCRVFLALT